MGNLHVHFYHGNFKAFRQELDGSGGGQGMGGGQGVSSAKGGSGSVGKSWSLSGGMGSVKGDP